LKSECRLSVSPWAADHCLAASLHLRQLSFVRWRGQRKPVWRWRPSCPIGWRAG
jgi:hypothetical protein